MIVCSLLMCMLLHRHPWRLRGRRRRRCTSPWESMPSRCRLGMPICGILCSEIAEVICCLGCWALMFYRSSLWWLLNFVCQCHFAGILPGWQDFGVCVCVCVCVKFENQCMMIVCLPLVLWKSKLPRLGLVAYYRKYDVNIFPWFFIVQFWRENSPILIC